MNDGPPYITCRCIWSTSEVAEAFGTRAFNNTILPCKEQVVFEWYPKKYTDHGVGPALGEVSDPFGGDCQVKWMDKPREGAKPIKTTLIRAAPLVGECMELRTTHPRNKTNKKLWITVVQYSKKGVHVKVSRKGKRHRPKTPPRLAKRVRKNSKSVVRASPGKQTRTRKRARASPGKQTPTRKSTRATPTRKSTRASPGKQTSVKSPAQVASRKSPRRGTPVEPGRAIIRADII